ncbi:MAG: sugar transferase, partial [Bacteroidota bacterium]|nr:sugar transferase [Bacteroidota bacterium]MDX5431863.1 sugar transferase [Bacteroidota bacterium]MDX5470575.1 sugar transferase [Bacteroidota bacterium]
MNIPTRYLKETEWQAYSRRWDFRAREALQGSVPSYLRLKRGMDIFISLSVLLLIGIWLIPLLAVLVRIESKGLPFFSQQRTGINGQTFTCYKIRTM